MYIFGSRLLLQSLVPTERWCYLDKIWTSSQIFACMNLLAWSSLTATLLPLSPSCSPRSLTAINIAVPEHLRALPQPQNASPALLTFTHLPPLFFLTKHHLWFSHSFHHPFRYSKVLDCCLKCLIEIKTKFLSEVKVQLSSRPQSQFSNLLPLHKSKLHVLTRVAW